MNKQKPNVNGKLKLAPAPIRNWAWWLKAFPDLENLKQEDHEL
jgi:hypothetical protein